MTFLIDFALLGFLFYTTTSVPFVSSIIYKKMNMKDRTAEFCALVERIKKRGNPHKSITTKRNQPLARSEFSRMAAQLGRSIASTSEKLEQLTYCKYVRY